jgi:hypothetical protein
MAIANITGNILTDSGVATSSLLPLTGGTLTGALNGTSAVFSGFLGVNGSPGTAFPFEAYINSSTAYSSTSRGNVMRVYNSNTGANVFAGIELGGAGTANDGLAGLNAIVTGSGSAALTFYTRDGGTFAERLRVAANGNVGIGTSSPDNILHVSGGTGTMKLEATTTNRSAIQIYNTANTLYVGVDNAAASYFGYSAYSANIQTLNYPIIFSNGPGAPAERMRIYNDGYISLNSVVFGTTTSGTIRTLYIGNGANYLIGGISSIRKSKTNIENLSNVDWIYDLNPVTFNYRKADENKNYTDEFYEDLNYGLIAEDTAPVADFLINYNDKEDGTKEMIGIEYPRLITPLLKAIQDQKKLIEELEAKVSALENKS